MKLYSCLLFVLCSTVFGSARADHELITPNTDFECARLSFYEELYLCTTEKEETPLPEGFSLWKGLQWFGKTGNGVEFVIRILNVADKVKGLYNGNCKMDSNWLKETLAYNTIEACDHVSEAFNIHISAFLQSWISWFNDTSGYLFSIAANPVRFLYLGYALRTDFYELKLERKRPAKTVMNTFALTVTAYNLGALIVSGVTGMEL
ncbi:hypothetical protein EOPP23_12945 [Endozoicomonas sp. OPT23]|uniref:hypothetical protein n=1 Tax=Endozoicomonas sp. OPT23 TaxID=2072845 RepID=UPI00129B4730|nr:hypothetical protein [Endozoicomonas sp. OPT23]MRI33895.1 hypothetical protein [Endozoicomonas sp. OPT23]